VVTARIAGIESTAKMAANRKMLSTDRLFSIRYPAR
jgi:hypothetical protein